VVPPPEAQIGRLPRRGPQQARGLGLHPPLAQRRLRPPPSQAQPAPSQLPPEHLQTWAPMPMVTGAVMMQPVGYPTVIPMQPMVFSSLVPVQPVSYSAVMPMQGLMYSGHVCPDRGQAAERAEVPSGPQMEQVQEEDLGGEEEVADEDDEDDDDSEGEDDEADEE